MMLTKKGWNILLLTAIPPADDNNETTSDIAIYNEVYCNTMVTYSDGSSGYRCLGREKCYDYAARLGRFVMQVACRAMVETFF
ncbi:hypothetical protein [uncultured Pelagimonas sp.]|uniref:hypothetical protein n=1 Tax=uncultured Pelagimonas sp. TaxID=1618102 RepID=UPI0026051863|nr:hypothetical protein [uncultured Pelagimonas sp.]